MSKQASELLLPTVDGRELKVRWTMRAVAELEEIIQSLGYKNLKDFAANSADLSIGTVDMLKCIRAGLSHLGDKRPSVDDLTDILYLESGFSGFVGEFMTVLALAMSGPEGAAEVKKSLEQTRVKLRKSLTEANS